MHVKVEAFIVLHGEASPEGAEHYEQEREWQVDRRSNCLVESDDTNHGRLDRRDSAYHRGALGLMMSVLGAVLLIHFLQHVAG